MWFLTYPTLNVDSIVWIGAMKLFSIFVFAVFHSYTFIFSHVAAFFKCRMTGGQDGSLPLEYYYYYEIDGIKIQRVTFTTKNRYKNNIMLKVLLIILCIILKSQQEPRLKQIQHIYQEILQKDFNNDVLAYRQQVMANNRQLIKKSNEVHKKFKLGENSFIIFTPQQFSQIYLNTIPSFQESLRFSKIIEYSPNVESGNQQQFKWDQNESTFTTAARIKNKIGQSKIEIETKNNSNSSGQFLNHNRTENQNLTSYQQMMKSQNNILEFIESIMIKNGRQKSQIQKIKQRYRFKTDISNETLWKQIFSKVKVDIDQNSLSRIQHNPKENVLFLSNFSNNRSHRLFFLQQSQPIMTYDQVIQYIQNVDWTCLSGQIHFRNLCGSSYVSAVSDSIAAVLAIYFYGYHIYLSGQDILDCSSNSLTFGCQCGFLQGSFLYAIRKGLRDGYNYPLLTTNYWQIPKNSCSSTEKQFPRFSIKTFKSTSSHDCKKLLIMLQSQPVVVGISGLPLMFYKKGVFDCDQTSEVNHAVLAIGYKKRKGWKLKNSWGSQWGEQGYFWLKANNSCSICELGYYPIPKEDEGYQLYSMNEVYASCPPP